ncbi:MAG: hypothetical protein ACT4QA_12170 [Panacagrimonas sp.]
MNTQSITRAITVAGMAVTIIAASAVYSSIAGATSGAASTSGSCPIAGADFGGPRFVKGASPDAGDAATAETAEAGATPAPVAALVAGGGCSAAVLPPDEGMTVASASAADDAGPTTLDELAQLDPEPTPESGTFEPEPEVVADTPEPVVRAAPRRAKPKPVPEVAKKAWWPAKTSGKLNLTYAGQASFGAAIALLFDGAFATPESANQNIQVKDGKGRAIRGQWVVATNRQMLLFTAAPGLYSVDVGVGLADQGGRGISASSAGLVFVQ